MKINVYLLKFNKVHFKKFLLNFYLSIKSKKTWIFFFNFIDFNFGQQILNNFGQNYKSRGGEKIFWRYWGRSNKFAFT